MVGVAQLVEHWVVASAVAGSNPVTHPIKYAITLGSYQVPFFIGSATQTRRNMKLKFLLKLINFINRIML